MLRSRKVKRVLARLLGGRSSTVGSGASRLSNCSENHCAVIALAVIGSLVRLPELLLPRDPHYLKRLDARSSLSRRYKRKLAIRRTGWHEACASSASPTRCNDRHHILRTEQRTLDYTCAKDDKAARVVGSPENFPASYGLEDADGSHRPPVVPIAGRPIPHNPLLQPSYLIYFGRLYEI